MSTFAGPVDWTEHGNRGKGGVSRSSSSGSRGEASTTTVVLVRHGQTSWNAEERYQGQLNSPLTKQGRQQAETVGRRLAGAGWVFDALISSDLGRAQETANLARKHLKGGPRIILDPSCRERNYGLWEGKTKDEVRAVCGDPSVVDDKHSLDLSPEGQGVESRAALQLRAQNFFVNVVRQHRGRTVCVVTHGAFMAEALKCLLGVSDKVKGRRATLKIANGCICVLTLERDAQEWQISTIGDQAHYEQHFQRSLASPLSLSSLILGVAIGMAASLALVKFWDKHSSAIL